VPPPYSGLSGISSIFTNLTMTCNPIVANSFLKSKGGGSSSGRNASSSGNTTFLVSSIHWFLLSQYDADHLSSLPSSHWGPSVSGHVLDLDHTPHCSRGYVRSCCVCPTIFCWVEARTYWWYHPCCFCGTRGEQVAWGFCSRGESKQWWFFQWCGRCIYDLLDGDCLCNL